MSAIYLPGGGRRDDTGPDASDGDPRVTHRTGGTETAFGSAPVPIITIQHLWSIVLDGRKYDVERRVNDQGTEWVVHSSSPWRELRADTRRRRAIIQVCLDDWWADESIAPLVPKCLQVDEVAPGEQERMF